MLNYQMWITYTDEIAKSPCVSSRYNSRILYVQSLIAKNQADCQRTTERKSLNICIYKIQYKQKASGTYRHYASR